MNEKVGCPRALVPKRGGRLYTVNDFLTFLPGRTGVLYKRHLFQVVVTNHAFAMLSKEIMIMCRRVHTQLLHVEADVDAQATDKLHVAMTGSLVGCHQSLSFLQICLPNVQEFILHIPFVHYREMLKIIAWRPQEC